MTTDPLEGRTVLVADDDPDILNMVSGVLEVSGYTVLRAKDGYEAKAVMSNAILDLAVFDLTMPGHGGNELCKMLKALPGGTLIPVMILTARDGIQDKVTSLEGGADDYVTKPFNHTELLARVKALLRIRMLNVSLSEKNDELRATQEKLIEQERALAVNQLAGAAAHNMGQPLSAIMLNLHLISQLSPNDDRYQKAISAIKFDARRMVDLLEQIKKADPRQTADYYGETAILELPEAEIEKSKTPNNVIQLPTKRSNPAD